MWRSCTPSGRLRLIAWNCCSGSVTERLAVLQPLYADIAFLQECRPGPQLPLHGDFLSFAVNDSKGIASARSLPITS